MEEQDYHRMYTGTNLVILLLRCHPCLLVTALTALSLHGITIVVAL